MTCSLQTKHFKLAHISDLHFSQLSWNPKQFLSKRWIGNANLLLRRMREFQHDKVFKLVEHFQKEGVDFVLISGDLSTTSLSSEFSKASLFIKQIKDLGMQVITLPGNHDHYTKKDYENKTFYQFFDSHFQVNEGPLSTFNLKDHKLAVKNLGLNWYVVALDTALATPLLACHGDFSEKIESTLRHVLNLIPEDGKVILANHFPLFTSDHLHKHLVRDKALRDMLQDYPKVKFYLHGHTHRHSIADLRNAGLPIIVDSGCTAHEEKGAWNLLEFSQDHCNVTAFRWGQTEDLHWDWVTKTAAAFDLS